MLQCNHINGRTNNCCQYGLIHCVPHQGSSNLYAIIDIYSRYVVGWLVAYRESSQIGPHFTC
jgi:hypothetical protein